MGDAVYEFTVELDAPMPDAEASVRESLRVEGFGVLTEIDVQAVLQSKLQEPFRPYRILGACNPGLAHRALQAEPGVGVFLPCNVVVEEAGEGRTRVRFMEPTAALNLIENDTLRAVAEDASTRLHRVADSLRSGSRA